MTEKDIVLYIKMKEEIQSLAEKYFEKNIKYCDDMNFLDVKVSHVVTIVYSELSYTGEYEVNEERISYEDFLKG